MLSMCYMTERTNIFAEPLVRLLSPPRGWEDVTLSLFPPFLPVSLGFRVSKHQN